MLFVRRGRKENQDLAGHGLGLDSVDWMPYGQKLQYDIGSSPVSQLHTAGK